MTLLRTFWNSLINLTRAYEIAPKASFIRAYAGTFYEPKQRVQLVTETHGRPARETHFRLNVVDLFFFFFFFLFIFPLVNPRHNRMPVKIYRSCKKTRKGKKCFSTPWPCFSPFTLVSSQGTSGRVYRTTRRIMNHTRYYITCSGGFAVDNFESIQSEGQPIRSTFLSF